MTDARSQTLAAHAGPLQSPDETHAERIELLLGRCARHRDERALQELYQLISSRLLGILMRILRRRPVAEEALQDVMVKIWERADQYDAYRGRAMAWITTIARYRAIDLLRRQQAAATTTLDDAPVDALVDINAADFVDTTTSNRLRKALNDCFVRLTAEQRRCLELAYVDGYSQEQIAGEIASPLGTVKSWIRRGLASLKRCLDS